MSRNFMPCCTRSITGTATLSPLFTEYWLMGFGIETVKRFQNTAIFGRYFKHKPNIHIFIYFDLCLAELLTYYRQ